MAITTGAQFGHYEILAPLGAGGMGEVYLVQDTKLDRQVALKILPDHFANDADRMNRFVREAKSASALNHPNIITIYEIGEADSTHYIATEYIEGQTLRQHIQHSRLKLRDVLDIQVQIASALATAHQAGIIHRDIKPENLMLRPDGIVKVLDFGLAKLSEKPAPTTDSEAATISRKATDPGTVMGTVQYMSPEQARGKTVDARTDIFSLGIVLYEMLAGRAPFTGESSTDVLAAILDKEPLPLARFTDEVPQELQRIVSKMLRKERDERYQTMKDVLLDLKELRDELAVEAKLERSIRPASNIENQQTLIIDAEITREAAIPTTSAATAQTASSAEYLVSEIKNHKRGFALVLVVLLMAASGLSYWYFSNRAASTKPIESIAVMPFVNEGGNADIEYLSDGMTETLISSLSQLPNLSVKARSSVFRYKGKATDAKTISEELNVQAILNGRVVQRGDQLTLSLELVDASTENVIWSEQYNRKQADLVSLQSEIARDVSSKLKTRLSGADEAKVTKTYTQNTEAYKLYLQGLFHANKRTTKDTQKAIEDFQQAIAIDSKYVLAYTGLADAYMFYTIYGDAPANETFPKAREIALKALALDNELAEAHSTLGVILFFQDHDFAGWEREVKRALELNPNFADGHRRNGLRLLWLGRFEEALIAFNRALEIEPLSIATNRNYAECLFYLGRYEASAAQTKKTLDLDPNFWYSHHLLFNIYRLKGNYALAIEPFAKAQELKGAPETAKLTRESFARGGWQGFLQAITSETSLIKLSPYDLASFHTELGKKDKAFVTLNEAFEKRDHFIPFVKIDPFLKPLHDDPRFQELLKKVGFPQ